MDSFDQAVKLICGKGTAPDWGEVRKLFEQAARSGHAKAQFNLGVMYAKGIGAEHDRQLAYRWFARAAAQGHSAARQVLSKYFQHTIEDGASPGMPKPENAICPLPSADNGDALQNVAATQSGAPGDSRISHEFHAGRQHAGTLGDAAIQSHRSFAMMLATLICVIAIVLVRGYFSLL